MKRTILTLFVAMLAIVFAKAQQIALVTKDGVTTLHRTLQGAIDGASHGSVIYLPGGGFPISEDVKITKRISIIGIGHKVKGENADGHTTITGDLYFNGGSSGSSVMGCYIAGEVKIGSDEAVHDILVRYCNLSAVRVLDETCTGTVVNQNYIRSASYFGDSEATFTNNVALSIHSLNNGFISNCVFLTPISYAIYECESCSITDNVFHSRYKCYNSQFDGNMVKVEPSQDDDNLVVYDGSWEDLFVDYSGISPNSDFHFKGEYAQYNGQIGIYGGSSFSDGQLPPVPFIIEKSIPEQTDASGKLNIKIRVKAGE